MSAAAVVDFAIKHRQLPSPGRDRCYRLFECLREGELERAVGLRWMQLGRISVLAGSSERNSAQDSRQITE